MNSERRAASAALFVVASYGVVGVIDGLVFHNRYHENALLLVIAMGILVFGARPLRWHLALISCLVLALFDAVIAWVVGRIVGLDAPMSFAQLLRNGLLAGLVAGGMYSALAWRWHRRQAAAGTSSGSSTA